MSQPTTDTDKANEPIWAQMWQMPALVLGMTLFVLGLYLAWPTPEEDDFAGVLDETALLLDAMSLEQAQAQLQTKLEPFIDRATALERARYEMLWGDLIYRQQKRHQWNKPENHQKILSHYREAEELGLALDGIHLQRLAETFVALNRDDEAMEVLDRLRDDSASRRYRVIKQIIKRRMEAGSTLEALAALLTRFEEEVRQESNKAVRRNQRLWSTILKAQGLMDARNPQQTVEYLQRRLIHFMADGGEQGLSPLWVLLGQAYQDLGEHEEAKRWLLLAQQKLAANDPLNADVLVRLAQIELAQTGDVRAALENFSIAEREHPTATSYLDALLGRADCEARLGAHPEAIDRLSKAIQIITDKPQTNPKRVGQVAKVITSHFDMNTAQEQFDLALDYLNLLKVLHGDTLTTELLAEFARTHKRIANQRRDDAQAMTDVTAEDQVNQAKRVAFREASVHFGQAGDFFLKHAHAVTQDDHLYGNSLWNAALAYDAAQMWDKAIKVYAEFGKTRSEDPRQLDAIRRLGIAYLSNGQYQTAVELLNQLVSEHGRSPEAYKSLVALARGHTALQDFDAAERVLRHVLTDHPSITPESAEYKEALIDLGSLYYQQQKFESAIERLTEAVERFEGSPQGAMLQFRLADGYRQSVDRLNQELDNPMSRSRQAALQAERARRLEQAITLFGQVIDELDARPEASLSPAEKLALRNAYIYRADSAYDLGRYEQAIALFDEAARRWDNHPVSLVALVQIVNAYCELGRLQEAKVANDRARWQLKRIPEAAFDDPSLPMTREHWEDWLRWTSELNLFGSQAQADNN